MTPFITVIRRRKHGIAFLEERFHGRQFRCTRCNRVFADVSEIGRHLAAEDSRLPAHRDVPRPDSRIDVRLAYLSDLKQALGERKRGRRDDP